MKIKITSQISFEIGKWSLRRAVKEHIIVFRAALNAIGPSIKTTIIS